MDFDKGGRFYGGWWEGIPSPYRAKLLIDGKRTEELDFGSLHPTILYAKHGLALPKDAYEISLRPTKFPKGKSIIDFRKVVKRAFNAMLNADKRLHAPPRELSLHEWGIKWGDLVEAIEDQHSPIETEFFSGVGLSLQYEDSQIAEELMIKFAQAKGMVPLLPVHDSFICHHGYAEEVRAMMVGIFKKRFGLDVKVSGVKVPENDKFKDNQSDLNNLLDYIDRPYEKRLDLFQRT